MTQHVKNNKIVILAGGKTGGPVIPLIALMQTWRSQDDRVVPVVFDINSSAGQHLASQNKWRFKRIVTGKFRRYWWAWQNLLAPLLLFVGFIQSIWLLKKLRPVLVIGAGGFVQVPVIYAAWLLRIPRAIHQQDILASLSNSLCAPVANLITTTFHDSVKDFPQGSGIGDNYLTSNKVFWTGNPVRSKLKHLPEPEQAKKSLGLSTDLPVLLVFGGGSGASALNQLITENLESLTKVVQILHSTGPGKMTTRSSGNYHALEFIENMPMAYAAADIVLARAGIGTLTELALVERPSIIVPMPETHQELNAFALYHSQAALVLDQVQITPQVLIEAIRKIMFNPSYAKSLTANMSQLFPKQANEKIVELLKDLIYDSKKS